jgi:hypothetical protein
VESKEDNFKQDLHCCVFFIFFVLLIILSLIGNFVGNYNGSP